MNVRALKKENRENCLKIISLDQKLNEKKEILSNKLQFLKTEYEISSMNQLEFNKDIIRQSLLKQIEILMDLISTTKFKN